MDILLIVHVVSILGGLGGIAFGLASYFRNKKKDDSEDGKQIGTVLTELGYIKSGVDDLKRKQDKQDEQSLQVMLDLKAVQESAKQAHKRIDALEQRVNDRT